MDKEVMVMVVMVVMMVMMKMMKMTVMLLTRSKLIVKQRVYCWEKMLTL